MAQDDLLWMRNFLQDDLYLLDVDKATVALPVAINEQQTPEISFNCLGTPGADTLILVKYPDDEHMPAAHLKVLESIFSRKGVTMNDTVILNLIKQSDSSYSAIASYFNPKKMLIMGPDAAPAGLAVPELNTIGESDEKRMLYTFAFEEMLQTEEKKRLFWNQMKTF